MRPSGQPDRWWMWTTSGFQSAHHWRHPFNGPFQVSAVPLRSVFATVQPMLR